MPIYIYHDNAYTMTMVVMYIIVDTRHIIVVVFVVGSGGGCCVHTPVYNVRGIKIVDGGGGDKGCVTPREIRTVR